MKNGTPFNVEFKYTLAENITLNLTAIVTLQHSVPHYLVSNFHFKNTQYGNALLPDISLIAKKTAAGITWLHMDSHKETMLSAAVGKAIEEKVEVEFANDKNKAKN